MGSEPCILCHRTGMIYSVSPTGKEEERHVCSICNSKSKDYMIVKCNFCKGLTYVPNEQAYDALSKLYKTELIAHVGSFGRGLVVVTSNCPECSGSYFSEIKRIAGHC